MTFGSFILVIDGERQDGTPEKKARLHLRSQGVDTLVDTDADQFRFPTQFAKSDGVPISLPYMLSLDTDSISGESTSIGYEGFVKTDEGRIDFEIAAQEAGTTKALADLTDVVAVPISTIQVYRDEAEAARDLAETYRDQAVAAAAAITVDGGTALDTLLASLPAWTYGDALRHITVKPGAYTRTTAVKVPSGTVLTMYGVTMTLANNVGDDVVRNADRVAGNSWIWILGGHLNGNAANQTNVSSPNPGQSGISIYNSHHVTVRDVHSRNTLRHGFDATTDTYANTSAATCSDISFVDCSATTFGDDGFTTHYANSVTFRGCVGYAGTGGLVALGASHGFEIDDGSFDVAIVNCTAYNHSRGRGFYVKAHTSAIYHARFTLIGCESYGNLLEGFGIQSESTTTTTKLSDVSMIGCWSHNNTGDGLRITNAANITVSEFSSFADDYGIRIVGNVGTDTFPLTRDIHVNGFRIVNPANHGIWMNETSVSRAVRFSNGLIKNANSDGIYAGQADATFESIIFEEIDVCPIRLKGAADRVSVNDCEFWDAVTTCINLETDVSNVTIRGNTFQAPAAGNTHGAIEFPATSTAQRVSIRGNKIIGAWPRGAYVITGAALTDVAVQDNDFKSATAAGVTKSGTVAGEFVVSGNLGYPTDTFGTGTIAAGSASVTVSHGLSGVIGRQPTAVLLTKRTSEDIWVSARSTSSFTVTRTGTTGALTFDWHALYQH